MSPYGPMSKCGRCGAGMHPLQNARRLVDKVVCMTCYEDVRLLVARPTERHERARIKAETFWNEDPPAELNHRDKPRGSRQTTCRCSSAQPCARGAATPLLVPISCAPLPTHAPHARTSSLGSQMQTQAQTQKVRPPRSTFEKVGSAAVREQGHVNFKMIARSGYASRRAVRHLAPI